MKRKICSFLLAFLLLLALTPAALADGAQLSYITDDAGILTASETASLEKAAQHIAQRYGVGIYLVTVNDACRIDSRGTYEAAYTYYHRNSLGAGAERNGAILLLSMNDRAFAHFYYGEKSEYAFNSYAQEQIEDTFLDNFRENDWYGGFSDYLSACGEYLALAAEGHPVRRSPVPAIVISCVAGVLIAFLVCSILKRKMKSVYVQARADAAVQVGQHIRENPAVGVRGVSGRLVDPGDAAVQVLDRARDALQRVRFHLADVDHRVGILHALAEVKRLCRVSVGEGNDTAGEEIRHFYAVALGGLRNAGCLRRLVGRGGRVAGAVAVRQMRIAAFAQQAADGGEDSRVRRNRLLRQGAGEQIRLEQNALFGLYKAGNAAEQINALQNSGIHRGLIISGNRNQRDGMLLHAQNPP